MKGQHFPQDHESLYAIGHANSRQFLGGEVVLIGAGPGDPDLLTLRAYNLIQQADVVVFDRLVSQEIMDLVPTETERFYVGKKSDHHTLPQDEINLLLVDLAKAGKRVARLKGGDSFIFGRGGEEVETLLKAGVACRVVPGITAASACTTYSGIPLTHRDFVHGVTFITGHLQDGKLNLPWEALAREDHTLVVYMGISTIPTLVSQLIKHGLPASLPLAFVSNGTTQKHRNVQSTLGTAVDDVSRYRIEPPTLIVIGHVVNFLARIAECENEQTALRQTSTAFHNRVAI